MFDGCVWLSSIIAPWWIQYDRVFGLHYDNKRKGLKNQALNRVFMGYSGGTYQSSVYIKL